MKIIAKAGSSTYLVEATADEIARVAGRGSTFQLSDEQRRRGFDIGSSIPVNEWWDFVDNLKRKEMTLRLLAETMHGLADVVSNAWPAILPPKKTEGGTNG